MHRQKALPILVSLLVVIGCRAATADDWSLVFEENFADDSYLDRWHLEGFADMALKGGPRARYLEIKTKCSADAPNNKQSVLWYKDRFAGDLRITFRAKGEAGNRALLYFNARPSAVSKRKSVLDWDRPDAQMTRYAGQDELEMYSVGILRDRDAACNLRHIGGTTAEAFRAKMKHRSEALLGKESIFLAYPSLFSGKPDTWFEFDVRIVGASISMTVDGKMVFRVEDVGHTEGGKLPWTPLTGGGWIAFRNFMPTTMCIADVKVYQKSEGRLK